MALNPMDYEQIRHLVARYNFAIDGGDVEAWADCFIEDGEFLCTPEDGPLTGQHVGREALRSYARQHFLVSKGSARHWNWNLAIQATDAGASMRCYLAAMSAASPGRPPVIRTTGIYRDDLVRRSTNWLFSRRHIHLDPQPLLEVG